MNIPTLAQWQRGIEILEQIVELENELAALIGRRVHARITIETSGPAQGDGRKGKRSPETIAKMKAAQQARWAKVNAPAAAKTEAPVKKKAGMSAAGKARIAAAQKARWAKIKADKAPVASKAPAEKRTLSPEARAKIAAAVKARWAAKKK